MSARLLRAPGQADARGECDDGVAVLWPRAASEERLFQYGKLPACVLPACMGNGKAPSGVRAAAAAACGLVVYSSNHCVLVLPLRSLARSLIRIRCGRTGDWRRRGGSRQGLQLHSSESATHSWFGQESCCWNSRGTGIVGSLSLCFSFLFFEKGARVSLSVSLFQRGLFFVFFVCCYGDVYANPKWMRKLGR